MDPKPLTVLHVGPLYNNHLARWAANTLALGCRVVVAGHEKPGRVPVQLAGLADHVEVAPADVGDEGEIEWLGDVIRRVEPDLIQAHWLPRWGYLATRAAATVPVIVTALGSDVYLAAGEHRRRADEATRAASRVICRSRHMRREFLSRGVPAERIADLDLGIDLERFRPASDPERTQLRRELQLPDGPLIFSMRAGTELYNLDVVLDAFESVRAQVPDAALVLVHGDAPLADQVRARLGKSGLFDVGHVPYVEMPSYFRAATIGVSLPRSDGSPSSVWEALAAGLPMVVSDLPQIRERVEQSGAVRLVPLRRDAVAAAMIGLLADHQERERMGAAGRDWAVAHVDVREQIELLGGLYTAIGSEAAAGSAPAVSSR
jgi:glycosyltransferase involved in cell wall biosynthesis